MELSEMKSMWTEVSQQMEIQKKITEEIVLDMTKLKYKRKFDKAILIEGLGAAICVICAIYIIINFENLDIWYLAICGGLAIFALLVLPIIVLRSLFNMRKVNVVAGNFKDVLVDFGKAKKRLNNTRKMGVILCAILATVIIPVCGKLLSNKDVFAPDQIHKLYFTISFMLVFMVVLMFFGFRYYKKLTRSTKEILKDLER